MVDVPRIMTDSHIKLIKLLESKGLELMEEVDFPPFKVDVYLPDYHVAIECDGPQHTKKKDIKRDRELGDKYQLLVFHVTTSMLAKTEATWAAIQNFLSIAIFSKDERWNEVENRLPWL